jgi:hypothetical protein
MRGKRRKVLATKKNKTNLATQTIRSRVEKSLTPLPRTVGGHCFQKSQLMDHNDLYVIDLSPSLRTLCLMTVIKNRDQLDVSK